MKSETAGNIATTVAAVIGNGAVNQIPGAIDATSNFIQGTGQAISNGVDQALDKIPKPTFDDFKDR